MKTSGAFLLCLILFFSCRKESFITSPDARLTISTDSLRFDTVFVSAGSTYGSFTIKNENDQKLRISSIRLMGGSSSFFKLNVDGVAGWQFNNLELEANDSVYVFVQVNIDPSATPLAFVIRDSIQVNYNGNTKWVQLEAWGQNAHFFRDKVITAPEIWNNDLPYVILGSLVIDVNRTLTINKGCRIYVHADAPIIVDGTLLVNGQKDSIDRVFFRGDRLDEPYRDFPGSWPGIFFRTNSKDNVLNYAVIRNAYQGIGIVDPSVNANPKLVINETIIDNAFDAGIISVNSSITARNCLVSNCGKNLFLTKGGNYQFNHCTIAGYSTRFINHKDPVALISNFIVANNMPVSANLDAVFRNCIFWGEEGLVDNEVEVIKNGNTLFNVFFDHGLWRVQSPPANSTISQYLNNQNPLFDSIDINHNYFNFHLKPNSPAINKGINSALVTDLDGNPRPVGLPDLGCYEKQ
jgi:hypothetical protein